MAAEHIRNTDLHLPYQILLSSASLARIWFNIQHWKRKEEKNDRGKHKSKTRYFQILEEKEEPEQRQWQWEEKYEKTGKVFLEMNWEWFLDFPFGRRKDGATFHWRRKHRRKCWLLFSEGRWGEHRRCSQFYLPCLENPMDRGAWRATVHGVTVSDMTERLTLILWFMRQNKTYWPSYEKTMVKNQVLWLESQES